MQKAEEELFDAAENVFRALPTDVQVRYKQVFSPAATALTDADNVFIAAVNAVLASGGTDFTTAIATLDQAVQAFLNQMEVIFGSTSSGQPSLKVLHDKMQNLLQASGR